MKSYLKNITCTAMIVFSSLATAESRIPISSPIQITQPGSYFLTNDIVASSYSSGITIEASDVTIDLNGFTISHTGVQLSDGIAIGSARNIEIANGTIKGFVRNGIFVIGNGSSTPADIRLRNLRLVENSGSGVVIQPPGFLLENCTISRNGSGVTAHSSGLVINNTIGGNKFSGLAAYTSATGYVSNVIYGNGTNVSGSPTNLGKNLCGTALCP